MPPLITSRPTEVTPLTSHNNRPLRRTSNPSISNFFNFYRNCYWEIQFLSNLNSNPGKMESTLRISSSMTAATMSVSRPIKSHLPRTSSWFGLRGRQLITTNHALSNNGAVSRSSPDVASIHSFTLSRSISIDRYVYI